MKGWNDTDDNSDDDDDADEMEWSVIGFASDFSEGVFWSTTHPHELFDGNKSDLDEFWNDWNVYMV